MVKVQQRGLGKGLSALISETSMAPAPVSTAAATDPAASHASVEPESIPGRADLPIDALVPGKFQPRVHFNEGHLQELAASIERNGIMQPIVVRPSERSVGKYEIIAGERRWRAARIAQLARVPVIVRDISDRQALELALVENIQRQDLSPLEEANGYQRLLEEFSYTQEELAETVGKSRSHISNLLRLLSLPDSIKARLEDGSLSMGHARALLTANDPEALAETITQKGLNVRQAEALARGQTNQPRQTRPRNGSPSRNVNVFAYNGAKDPDIVALEETLSGNLGLQVSIDDQGQQGAITISYNSLSELDRILQKLGNETGAF